MDELDKKIKGIIYISGPMTGLPDYNYPLFNATAAALRKRGYAVINPAEFFGGKADRTREEYMRESILRLMEADGLMLLPEWHKSPGAVLEVAIARELEMSLYTLDNSKETPETLF